MEAIRNNTIDFHGLARRIPTWAAELGFQRAGICDIDLGKAEQHLHNWLRLQRQGEMSYMDAHGARRSRPAKLIPGTCRVISVRMDYQPRDTVNSLNILADSNKAMISRYALGRDYHKIMRRRLQRLADRISTEIGPFGYRVFSDSAPVLEKALAEKAGLGWIGKHTNLLARDAGSWFFLGEIYTDLPLPVSAPAAHHCGRCRACIDACPTGAIVAPYQLDARRCIAYLTIELRGSIPVELRPMMGNRIYGCDDCQLTCPWNRFARVSAEADFVPRHGLDQAELITLFNWSQTEFQKKTEGMALRRIGHEQWLRNIAVALGNSPCNEAIIHILKKRTAHPSALVQEHVNWALDQQT